MELTEIKPTRAGQICKIIIPSEEAESDDVYLICEDPSGFADEDDIYVASLKELQRNINSPELTEQFSIAKRDLSVIADDLEAYILSWNAK